MKEDHYHEIQTPKSSNRKPKSLIPHVKKLNNHNQKVVKKNLSSVFAPVTEISSIDEAIDVDQSPVEDVVLDDALLAEDSVAVSDLSEAFVFDEEQCGESIENYIMSLNQFMSPSSVAVTATAGSEEMTPLSSIATVDMTPSSSPPISAGLVTCGGTTAEKVNSSELEPLVKHLRESMIQVSNSSDSEPQYKKLLDALVKIVIEEFYSLHEEKNMTFELFSRKAKTVLLSSVMGILAVSTGFLLLSDVQSSYSSPPPT